MWAVFFWLSVTAPRAPRVLKFIIFEMPVFRPFMRNLRILIVLLLVGEASAVSAQSFYAIRKERSVILNVGVGSANYFGELVNPGTLGTLKAGLNVGLEKGFLNRFSSRAEVTFYQISGTDANANDSRVVRNLSFHSNNIEANFAFTAELFPRGRRFYQRPTINFYGFAGLGVTYINPTTQYLGEKVALQPLQTEGIKYSKFQPVIPLGGGIKLKAGPFFNLALEAGIRKTFTDYLDDVSVKDYPDPATLSSDLARALSNRSGGEASVRGNPETDDWYFMMTARVQYYLPYDFNLQRNKLYTKKRKLYNSRPRR